VLGIDRRSAGAAEIKTAYKRAAQKAHPDKKGGSNQKMKELNHARDEALASAQAR
jgi:curved DNA-binding protein CbpA